jgi:acyl-coenzyme A synthetase/AMP-(fatty) acid ligase
MVYLGRMDNQVKILGHRVELGEIESVVRNASGVEGVAAIGWPATASGADGIEVFLQTDVIDTKALQEKLKSKLPLYMVPHNIRLLPQFPLNANGKYDRKALTRILEETK